MNDLKSEQIMISLHSINCKTELPEVNYNRYEYYKSGVRGIIPNKLPGILGNESKCSIYLFTVCHCDLQAPLWNIIPNNKSGRSRVNHFVLKTDSQLGGWEVKASHSSARGPGIISPNQIMGRNLSGLTLVKRVAQVHSVFNSRYYLGGVAICLTPSGSNEQTREV